MLFLATPDGTENVQLSLENGGSLFVIPTLGVPGPPGVGTFPGNVTQYVPGAAVTLTRAGSQVAIVNTTGAVVTLTMPAAPHDLDTVTVLARGASITPPILAPNAGQTLDDPASPGVAAAGTVALTFVGQAVTWMWSSALSAWVLLINS